MSKRISKGRQTSLFLFFFCFCRNKNTICFGLLLLVFSVLSSNSGWAKQEKENKIKTKPNTIHEENL